MQIFIIFRSLQFLFYLFSFCCIGRYSVSYLYFLYFFIYFYSFIRCVLWRPWNVIFSLLIQLFSLFSLSLVNVLIHYYVHHFLSFIAKFVSLIYAVYQSLPSYIPLHVFLLCYESLVFVSLSTICCYLIFCSPFLFSLRL